MPKTRKGTSSTEDTATTEQPEQVEAPQDTPSSSKPVAEKQEDDAASKAQDRKARFKALQARAVSHISPARTIYKSFY